jgi:hypothetical protein
MATAWVITLCARGAADPVIAIYPDTNACTLARGEKPGQSGPDIKYLGLAGSMDSCDSLATSKLHCLSACWLSNPKNSSFKNMCYCHVDPLWMPMQVGEGEASSSQIVWPCEGDSDCSYNGKCDQANGKCQCSPAWSGPRCAKLDLLPVDKQQMGYREVTHFWC